MTTTEWSVEVEVAGEGESVDLDLLDDFMELLEPYNASVTGTPEAPEPAGTARYGAILSIDAADVESAVAEGVRVFRDHAEKVGLEPWPIVSMRVMTEEELDAELARPTFPTLLGVAELAAVLGVSKQRASELANSTRFPRPFLTLASGPIWLEPAVLRFVETWDRKPGRPRSEASA